MGICGAIFDSAYRTAYSFLSMLPEDAALRCGQWALKNLPIEYFAPILEDNRLGVSIGGLLLPNPVILASYYRDSAIWEKAFALGFGGVTTKTTTLKERQRKPCTVVRKGKGFVNREEYPNHGLYGMKKELDAFRSLYTGKGKLIVSLGAIDDINEYAALAKELEPYADFIEVNGSSPNNEIAYNMATNIYCIERASQEVRDGCTIPVIWKLSPNYAEENRRTVIPRLIKNGIEIIEWGNTRRVEEPRLPGGFGGLSGPDIYGYMHRNVIEVAMEFGNDIDIIACGGIDSVEKAMELLSYANGAAMLSGFVHDIGLPRKISEKLIEKFNI